MTSIRELNNEIDRLSLLIDKKQYSDIVKIIDFGGYSSKGRKISLGEGFGTRLVEYVKIQNLTDIPLVITFKFDLEKYYSWNREANLVECWFGNCGKVHESEWSVYEKNKSGTLKLYSMEEDYGNLYYDKIKYYSGYRVTQERSDGSYSYSWDDQNSFKVSNLKIASIAIWR